MPNPYFKFKQFTVFHDRCAMKVTTEACLFGAWIANQRIQAESVLDIGGGSGLLSLMLAQQMKSKIHTIEIEYDAFEQMKTNFDASPWKESLKAIQGDVLSYAPSQFFDLIISNPPFYENDLKSNDGKRNMALHDDGLTLHKLIEVVYDFLSDDGQFAILIPHFKASSCIQLAQTHGLYLWSHMQVSQTPKHEIFRSMLLFSKQKRTEALLAKMEIKTANGNYSQEFSELLASYYLYL